MAYYVGTREFPSVYEAVRYLAANPQPGVSVTSAPVGTNNGMLTGGTVKDDKMYAGGTPNFDERTGQSKGKSEKKSTKQTTTSKTSSEKTTQKPTSTTTSTSTAQPKSEMTFTFIEGSERGDAKPGELWGQTVEPKQVTESELRDYFNDPKRTNRLPEVFGTFENYLGYMTEREQLLQSGELTLGDWGSAANITGPTETITLEDGTEVEIPAIDIGMSIGGGGELGIGQAGGGGGANVAAESEIMLQQGAYEDWLNSEANQALLQKYGVNPVVYSETGDKFQWNGSSYVKTVDIKNPDAGDYVKAGLLAAVSFYAGGALTQALGPVFGGNTALAAGASAGITNSAMQLAATGEVDLSEALESAISAGLSTAAINYLQESGALESITESLNDLTQDTVQLADGTELPINTYGNNTFVTLSDGTEVLYSDFITQTAEAGNAVVAEIERTTSDFINIVADAFESSGAAQGVVNVLESMESSSSPYPTAAEGQATFNLPGFGTIEEEEQQQIEQIETPVETPVEEPVEEPAEEPVEEDIFTDTTQEATGFEEGTITEDLLGEYLEPIRSEITASEERIVSQTQEFLASALANLPPNTSQEEIEAIVRNVVENAPQTETLSEEQVDGLVNSAVNAVRADLETGLETAETERQEIIAGQEAIRTELSSDIQSLEERLNNLPPEIREIVAEQIDNLEITDDISSVRQAVTALEDVVSNIQPGTTPEQVAEQIEQADLVTSGELGEQITSLEERIDVNAVQQLAELTGLRSEFLETLSVSEAAAIARNQGLSDQVTEQITGIRGETASQIEGINERLTDRINAYEQQTGEQLDIAAEERAALGGQLGTLTADVARVAEDVIRADGRIEELDEESRQRFDDLGLSLNELSLRVGVNLEALQEGMLTQDAALRELIEETTQQTEQTLTERLEEAEQGFATSLSDTEANLLSQITGVEAGVLQQLAEVEGGLQSQFGEQFGEVQQQVEGLGEQITGVGEGLAGLGEGVASLGAGLGMGLLGLGQQQQQLAAQLAKPEPIPFDPFLKGLSPFQPLTPLSLSPVQQKDAVGELNKFIGRQTGMLV